MDYTGFFGFQDEPFRLTPDTEYFFPSRSHQGALEALKYVFRSAEGFAVILGEAGVGKTLVLRLALKELPPNKEVAVILTPNLNPTELLVAILRDLKVPIKEEVPSKDQLIRVFSEYLLGEAKEEKGVIIVIDEAQNLPIESLEQLRLLSNLETEKKKLLQIVLVGQPELLDKINDKRLRQLNQRITIKETLEPFCLKETRDYIFFRLSKAGRGNLTVRKGAIRVVHRFSGGIPRKINALFSRALLLAYSDEKTVIDKGYIKRAYNTMVIQGDKSSTRRLPFILLPVMLLVALLLGASLFMTIAKRAKPKATPVCSQEPPPKKEEPPAIQKKSPPPTEQPLSDQELYEKGYQLFVDGKVDEAREVFRRLVKKFPNSTWADNALYWLGESFYAQKEWEKAGACFSRILKDYPSGNKVPDALLKMALIHWNEEDWKKAESELSEVAEKYPQTPAGKQAQERLKELEDLIRKGEVGK